MVRTAAGHELTPPFWINSIELIPARNGVTDRLVVGSNHHFTDQEQVVMLDSRGKLISEYWHRGGLLRSAVAALDRYGYPEVVFGRAGDPRRLRRMAVGGNSLLPNGTTDFADLGFV